MATFPTSPSFQSVNFKVNTPILRSTSLSGISRRVAMGNQFYSFTVKFPPLSPSDQGTVNGFLAARLGGYEAFDIILPEISYSKAQHPGDHTITVTGALAAGGNTVTYNVAGSGNHYKNMFAAGDFIRFSNHSKVYQVTTSSTSNGSGNGTIVIGGLLVASITTATTIQRDAVPFSVVLAADENSFEVGFGGYTSISLDLREVWGT